MWIRQHISARYFEKLVRQQWATLLAELPFDIAYSVARTFHVKIRADSFSSRTQDTLYLFGTFQGCLIRCPIGHRHQRPLITIYREPILDTTEREKIRDAIRGILIHEFCHWMGLNDQEAWSIGQQDGWFLKITQLLHQRQSA